MLDPNLRGPTMTGMNETLTRQVLDEAQAYLDQVAERLGGLGVTVQTRIVLGTHPVEAILEETRE
jgi:nucleotide-binding universal stress UspA family protein